jgi:hypothetical protein
VRAPDGTAARPEHPATTKSSTAHQQPVGTTTEGEVPPTERALRMAKAGYRDQAGSFPLPTTAVLHAPSR